MVARSTPSTSEPLDRELLLERFDGIRQFAQGGKRAPHKPLLLLYALGRLKQDKAAEVRFNAAEATVRPLLQSYGPWHSGAHVSYPYSRLVNDGLWWLEGREKLLGPGGDLRVAAARQLDARAGFTPEVLAAFDRYPELIDVVALRLLDQHFAPSLHEEILESIGLELGVLRRQRRGSAFRAEVLKAYLAECCVCGFSLRVADGSIAVDAAHFRWHAHGGPDDVANGLALCALHHRLFDHGAITVSEDLQLRVSRALAGSSARQMLTEFHGQELRLPFEKALYPDPAHLRWHHKQVFHGEV